LSVHWYTASDCLSIDIQLLIVCPLIYSFWLSVHWYIASDCLSIDTQLLSEAIYQWTDNQKLYINGQTIRSLYINGQTIRSLYINGQTIRSCISMDRQSEAVYQWTDNEKLQLLIVCPLIYKLLIICPLIYSFWLSVHWYTSFWLSVHWYTASHCLSIDIQLLMKLYINGQIIRSYISMDR
jgi:hypothetical protein